MLLPALLLALACSGQHSPGVALAVNLPDNNAMHRDFAAGFAAVMAKRWRMLTPQLSPADTSACGAAPACLTRRARERGATQLFIVGIAALGQREFVVSIQLFDVGRPAAVFSYSDVASPGRDGRAAGTALAEQELPKIAGLPEAHDDGVGGALVAPDPQAVRGGGAPTWVTWTGVGLLGASAIAVATTAALNIAHFQGAAGNDRAIADGSQTDDIAIAGGSVGVALGAAGLTLFIVDALMHP